MKSAAKLLVKALNTAVRFVGYEVDVKNLSGYPATPPAPDWMKADAPRPDDASIPGGWDSNVLEMASRAHRPPRLAHHRTRMGDDPRLKYVAFFLDVRGLRTLELGPHEGHYSLILEKLGVRENVAIEVRPENIARCERVKELHRLDRTTFVGQNIEDLYNGAEPPAFSGPFDLVFCLGLLYHLPEPARALRWIRARAPRLFLGTHYVEPAEARRYLPEVLRAAEYVEDGRVYRGMQYREGGMGDPISGASASSFWPFEADLLAMVRDAGYSRVEVLGKDLWNRMPHITLMAE